jgi:hypothetical protein
MTAMAKTAKRQLPAQTRRTVRATRGELRSLSARGHAADGGLIEGHVRSVDSKGVAHAVLATGETIEALCPAHIDARWLR